MGALSDYADYYRSLQGDSGGGSSAADLFNQAMLDGGFDPSGQPIAGAGGDESNPLTWAAMSISQKTSLLPDWARDLKVLGLGATQDPSPFVFMSDRKVTGTPGTFDTPQGFNETVEGTPAGEVTKAQTVARAKGLPYLWEEDEMDAAMKRMQDAGLNVTDFDSMVLAWDGLVDRASTTYMLSEGEKKVTPWDVLDLIQREDEAANGGDDELDPNRSVTKVSKSIQDITEGQAWSVLQNNLSRMLGRDPSDQEIRDFTHRMNGLAARNPAISKTVQQYKDGEVVSETSRVDPGFTADDMMQTSYEAAQSDPEYGAFQAASTYFNATQSALGAIGDV